MTEIIMYDSPEAAKPHTMSGWLSRNGYFYSDEYVARYNGCTHRPCLECGEPAEKHNCHCKACRNKLDIKRHKARKRKPWDGKAMIYSEALDRYYSDPADALEDAEEEGIDEPMLRICEPEYARPIENDYFQDQLPEDEDDLPCEVVEAMDAFNAAIKGVILSWVPGGFALDFEGRRVA